MADGIIKVLEYLTTNPIVQGALIAMALVYGVTFALVIAIFVTALFNVRKHRWDK